MLAEGIFTHSRSENAGFNTAYPTLLPGRCHGRDGLRRLLVFESFLVRNGQLLPSFATAACQYAAAVSSGHPFTESMLVFPLLARRLISTFHDFLCFFPKGLQIWPGIREFARSIDPHRKTRRKKPARTSKSIFPAFSSDLQFRFHRADLLKF